MSFYHMLTSENLNYRLKILRQLLIYMDELRPILPNVQQKVDVSLALQNLEILQRFDSIDALKRSLSKVDSDWHWLIEEMNLSEDFQDKHADSILLFLANNGAHIAKTYMGSLGDYQRRAYQRVVKAELMGQLAELKYFEGDLQKELSVPISDQMMESWKNNLFCTRNELEVGEYDDFFSTMLLGIKPQKTCLSYINDAQSQCLLSSFDSNSISSDNKAFQPSKGGYSLYGRCLDGTDYGVRLERYMQEEYGGPDGWIAEDCCIVGYMLSDTEHGGLLLPQMFFSHNAARKAIMVMPDTYDRESDKWTVLPIRIYDSCHIDFETEPDLSKNNDQACSKVCKICGE